MHTEKRIGPNTDACFSLLSLDQLSCCDIALFELYSVCANKYIKYCYPI